MYSPEASVRDALEAIDVVGIGAAVVVNGTGQILGIVTDGDCRRHFLKGGARGRCALVGDDLKPVSC